MNYYNVYLATFFSGGERGHKEGFSIRDKKGKKYYAIRELPLVVLQ